MVLHSFPQDKAFQRQTQHSAGTPNHGLTPPSVHLFTAHTVSAEVCTECDHAPSWNDG